MTDHNDQFGDPHAARDKLEKLGAKLEGVGSHFGPYVTSGQQFGDDMVLICYNLGWGEKTETICLPHQAYVEKLKEIIKAYPGLTTVSITPISSQRRVIIPREIVEAL